MAMNMETFERHVDDVYSVLKDVMSRDEIKERLEKAMKSRVLGTIADINLAKINLVREHGRDPSELKVFVLKNIKEIKPC